MGYIVAIPTNRNIELLDPLLGMLERQQRCPQFRVIVIDNATPLQLGETRVLKWRVSVEVIRLSDCGLARARNAALEAARDGDVVIFLDDDMAINAGFVAAYAEAFEQDGSLDAAGGPIVSVLPDRRPFWFRGRFRSFLGHHQRDPGYVYGRDTPFGGNFAVRKQRDVISFNPSFGLGGGQGRLGEEVQFFRVNQFSRVVYVEKATAYHIVSRNQLQFTWFLKRLWSQLKTRRAMRT